MKANCWEKHQGSFTPHVTVFSEVRDSVQGELAIRVFKNNKVNRVVKFLSKFRSQQPTFNRLCSRQADLKQFLLTWVVSPFIEQLTDMFIVLLFTFLKTSRESPFQISSFTYPFTTLGDSFATGTQENQGSRTSLLRTSGRSEGERTSRGDCPLPTTTKTLWICSGPDSCSIACLASSCPALQDS